MDDNNSILRPIQAKFNRQYQNQKVGNALKSLNILAADKADSQLRAACIEMESLFINYLFKEMRATIDKSGFISGGRAEEIFTGMLDAEQSKKIPTAGGIGLSSILLEQLGGKAMTQEDPEAR